MKTFKVLSAFVFAFIVFSACSGSDNFVHVKNGHFEQNGKKISFIGTNFWYGAILASDGQGGDKERLTAELDTLKGLGITNLRVLVGGDGPDGIPTRIEPTLQKAPGEYNDTILRGLDYLLVEMAKRDMKAVLYLNNTWEWSGGFGCYLEWAGAGKALIPAIDGYQPFKEQMAGFSTNEKAQELFYQHIRNIVSRRNSITGKPYKDDVTIFSWQIANEPRCFSADTIVRQKFVEWIGKAASIIKECDPNHMVSAGSEGYMGCEQNWELFEKVHSHPQIDYITIHIWPYNWSWAPAPKPEDYIWASIDSTKKYLAGHAAIAERLSKPIVVEEFGFPRDAMRNDWGTWGRDHYYQTIADAVVESDRNGGVFAGLNFWGWSGYAPKQPNGTFWEKGMPYCGDPAQEVQGLNGVYVSDVSTTDIIKKAAAHTNCNYSVEALLENDWLYTLDDQKPLRVLVRTKQGRAGRVDVSLELKTDKGEAYKNFTTTARPGRMTDTIEFHMGLEPGFYKARLYVEKDGLTEKAFNVGCEPTAIVSPRDAQDDFEAFWEDTRKQLDDVSPNFRRTLIPERSNDVRRTYRIDMISFGGVPIRGWLVEPVKEGKYPVRIAFNGYNSMPWPEDPNANPNRIDFTTSAREQGISEFSPPVKDWVTRGISSKETYYYRGAYMDCVRAMEFVQTLPKADLSNVWAEGGSQGGAFTLVTAALMPDLFKCIVPMVPFLSDFPDYLEMENWPSSAIFSVWEKEGITREEGLKVLSYFDVKNFAKYIKCPTLMCFGLQDNICPPHTNFGGYNLISGPDKFYKGFPLSGHDIHNQEPRLSEERNKFLQKYMFNNQ